MTAPAPLPETSPSPSTDAAPGTAPAPGTATAPGPARTQATATGPAPSLGPAPASDPEPGPGPESAGPEQREGTERLLRLLCAAMGIGAATFGALSLPAFLAQAAGPQFVLSLIGWVLLFGLPVAIGVLWTWAPMRVLRVLAITEGIVFLVILAMWLVLADGPLPGSAEIPWVITFTAIPALAVAIVARGRVAWAYTALVCAASGQLRAVTTTDRHPTLVGVEDGLYSLLFVGVFVGLTLTLRSSSCRLDRAARAVRANFASRAARVSRKQERLTIDAIIHDSVISTLLMAGRGRVDTDVLSRHAAKTLGQLDALRLPMPATTLTGSEVVRRLALLTAELAPDAALRTDLDDELSVPPLAADALLGAVGEALRNSTAQAGGDRDRAVARTVVVHTSPGGIRVVVHDNGVGFDVRRVPAERLGIAQSIIGRMERISGGAAAVRSKPGAGTEVVVSWTRSRTPDSPLFQFDSAEPPRSAVPSRTADRSRPAAPPRLVDLSRAAPPSPPSPPAEPSTTVQPPQSAERPSPGAREPRSRPPQSSLFGAFGVSDRSARVMLALFIGVHALLAFADDEPVSGLPLEVLGFLTVSTAAVWLTLAAPDPLPAVRTAGILALCGVTLASLSLQVAPVGAPAFAHWHLGAVTLLLLLVAVRGRPGWAWAAYVGMVAITITWALANGLAVGDGVALVIRHGGTLLAGSLFASGLRRSAANLAALDRERTVLAVSEATAVAALQEREAHLGRVNALARPALNRLARAHELADDERAECLLVEASLRDALRGRAMFTEAVIDAARSARSRGVEVILLDDSGDQPPARIAAVAQAVAGELDALASGRFTARVLPADRPIIATMVIESVEHRMLVVTPDGSVSEG